MSDKESNPESKSPEALSSVAIISEQEKQLASSATADFNAGRYSSCIETLNKLQSLRPSDAKVAHNKAVATYYASGRKKCDEFNKSLNDVAARLRIKLCNSNTFDDVDHTVIFFNQAVLYYHSQQYRKAIIILDKLFQFMEPLDESIARRICFLYIELCLCLQQPEKGISLICYTENLLFGSKQVSELSSQKPASPEKEPEGKDIVMPASEDSSPNEIYKTILQQYRARCMIMLKSIKASKREIKNLVSSGANTTQTVFLRSQLEFMRGNYRKTVKVLNTAIGQSSLDTRLTAMYNNNIGCVHFYTGKPNLGCFYFSKALKGYTENRFNSGMGNNFDSRLYYQLLYNLGLQNLYAGNYTSAFDCLIEAVRFYSTNPRLWLRIAECCVYQHKSDNAADFQLKDRKKHMIRGTAGSGPYRKIMLSASISRDNYIPVTDQSTAMPALTLEFATLSLQNALLLLSEPAANTLPTDTGDDSALLENGAVITSTTSADEITSLRNSVLALSAYVALCLNDTVVALKHADTLLAQPRVSDVHRLLGHQYAAEALLLLDRVPDTIAHLNPEQIKDMSHMLPELEEMKDGTKQASEENDKGYRKSWFPTSVSTAKVVSLYNLAVAYTLRGELSKATETLRLVSVAKGPDPEIPVQALMLAIYVQLQQGHADLAKSIIKQHLPQYK
uniref:CCR4-NOT transcription complex subunit 10 n=1 Tax=Ornithodoros turicata TaxID=34597 RepID=A0A2R5L5U8_9ACAR